MNFYTPIVYQGEITGVITGYIAATSQIAPLFETKLYGEDIYGILLDENNKRAFKEIAEIRDINATANMGTWRIELVEGDTPQMFVDETMKKLLGISGQNNTPEETYTDWFDNIIPEAVESVLSSVERMKQGRFDENTYLWIHPTKGERYVRCGGTSKMIPGDILLAVTIMMLTIWFVRTRLRLQCFRMHCLKKMNIMKH